MPTQPKCSQCKRVSGYTSSVESGKCQRCLNKNSEKKNAENGDKD